MLYEFDVLQENSIQPQEQQELEQKELESEFCVSLLFYETHLLRKHSVCVISVKKASKQANTYEHKHQNTTHFTNEKTK